MSSDDATDVSSNDLNDESPAVPADTGDGLVDELIEEACAEGDIDRAARIRLRGQKILSSASMAPLVTNASLPG